MHLKKVIFHSQEYPAADCHPFNLPLFHFSQFNMSKPITTVYIKIL